MILNNQLRSPWWLVLGVSLVSLMVNLDFTAVNIALVKITQDMHTKLATTQWLLSSYLLVWGAFIVATGRCSDIYGRRRFCLLGIFIFGLASLLVGISTNIEWMIAARILQSIGGALFIPSLYSLIFLTFPPKQQGVAIGLACGAVGLGLALGPTIGAVFTDLLSWRYIFLINIPLCLMSYWLISSVVKKEPCRISDDKIHFLHAIYLSLGLIVFFVGFNLIGLRKEESLFGAMLIIIAVSIIARFIQKQRHHPNPLLDVKLFKQPSFVTATIVNGLLQYAFASITFIFGIYLQSVMGYSILNTGLIFLAMTISFGLLAPFGGKLVDLFNIKAPILAGLILLIIGSSLFVFRSAIMSYSMILVILTLCGVGVGLGFSGLNTAMLKSIPKETVGIASGIFSMFALLGSTAGVLATNLVMHFFKPNHIKLAMADAMVATIIALIIASLLFIIKYEELRENVFA